MIGSYATDRDAGACAPAIPLGTFTDPGLVEADIAFLAYWRLRSQRIRSASALTRPTVGWRGNCGPGSARRSAEVAAVLCVDRSPMSCASRASVTCHLKSWLLNTGRRCFRQE